MGFKNSKGEDSGSSVDRVANEMKAEVPDALLAAAVVLEGDVKQLLLTPGRGRLRQSGATRPDRLGRGSFRRVVIDAVLAGGRGTLGSRRTSSPAREVRRMVRRGVPRTKIDLTNRASLPGDPPAPDTGTLQRSITHEVISSRVVRVGSNMVYAPYLEFGSLPSGSRVAAAAGRGRLGSRIGGIAPRPFMRPAIVRTAQSRPSAMIAVLRRSVKRG